MDFEKYQLASGLRVILAPMKNTETATVLFLVGTGAKYENKRNNGVSHFLEHLFFKGTKKRPRPKDITAEIDAIGGGFNAFTGKELTGYWNKVNYKYLPLALDIVSDIAINSTLPKEEIERERGVILEEINMYEDIPMNKNLRDWEKVLYGNQPAGWEILGQREIIKKITREEIIDYWKSHYKAKNSLVVVAGNLSAVKDVKKEIEKCFKGVAGGDPQKKLPVKENQKKPNMLVSFKETDQTHFIVGFKGGSLKNEKDRFPLSVLSTMLGGYMSARLFQEIREKRGWAYYVHSYTDFYSDAGFVSGRAGVLNDKSPEAISIVLREFKKLKDGKFTKKEITSAKNNIIGKMSLGLESSDEIGDFLAEQEILKNKILTPEQIFDKIRAVSADDLKRVAKKYFVNKGLNLALIGPHKNKKPFEKILKI